MKIVNKLVRDKVPKILIEKNKKINIKFLHGGDYMISLENKLLEECKEVIGAIDAESKLEGLADLLEVIHAVSNFVNISFEDIENVRLKKREKLGGFDSKIFLESIV